MGGRLRAIGILRAQNVAEHRVIDSPNQTLQIVSAPNLEGNNHDPLPLMRVQGKISK